MRHRFADCELDTDSLTLTRSGQPVTVEPQVFDLIRLLVEQAGRVVSRDEIVAVVWKGRIVSDSAISARIAAARKAVGDDGKRQAVIRTVARRGLQLVPDATPSKPDTDAPRPQTRATTGTAPPRVRYTRNGQGQMLAYTLSGNGAPVLNMSFFSRGVGLEWEVPSRERLLSPLAERHQIACYNEIGAGLSHPDNSGVTMAQKAEDLRAVADAAGFDRFSIFAESSGGLPAITFAATYPERVKCMVLSGCYAEGRQRRASDPQSDFIRSLIAEGWGSTENAFSRAYLTAFCPDGPYEAANDVAEMMRRSVPREAMLVQRDLQSSTSVLPLLDKITCPVLLIHARRDSVHPLSEAQKLAGGIAKAELTVLDSANHLPLYGSPLFDGYVSTILGYLAEHG